MRFETVDALSEAQVARAREIYETSFPPALRQDFATLTADRVSAYVDGDRVVGLVVLRTMRDPGWQFLRYFVVGERGRGQGSAMWRDLVASPGLTRLVLDVEDPDEPGIDAAEETERRRRIVFYERLGAVVLPVRSYAPVQPGGVAEPLLLLTSPPVASPDEVAEIVVATYRDRYQTAADDPVVSGTLAASGLTAP